MIGIICALKEELDEILVFAKNIKIENQYPFKFIIGTIHGVNCCMVLCGVGKVSSAVCTQALILKYHPDLILNVGVAGGIDKNISIGDIVIANFVIQHDFDVSAFSHRKKGEISGLNLIKIPCSKWITDKLLICSQKITDINLHTGTILTGDQFINSQEKLYELKNEFDGKACEMEAGSIGHVCYLNKTDFGIIRSISDNANSESAQNYKKFVKSSSKKASSLLAEFIKSSRD
ncbi:MAG: 5'-methylthioadenosine/adenosylhomocysteine nucleosidase [Clostridia bacterium]|nr:5'-methylthioadenosine/adenosylhomocysteine nucleosidase [Clostridia bacterium]